MYLQFVLHVMLCNVIFRPRNMFTFSTIIMIITIIITLTLSLLMYIYMQLLVKPEILTSYIYGLMFGNAESRLFLFAAQCFNMESMQNVFLCHNCV
jgi:hypothetical protein